MGFYRSTKRRNYRRSRRYFRKSSSKLLKRVKKDILKNNFPTKIKFIGLPEKKIMFLQATQTVTIPADTGKTLILNPLHTSNVNTLYDSMTVNNNPNIKICNWDKICVLAIYIRIQPNMNMFTGAGASVIRPVKCYYSINNNVDGPVANINAYNAALLNKKNIFTFNSNESFTLVLKGPSSMSTATPSIHKSYSWWSIADSKKESIVDNDHPILKDENEEEEEENVTNEDEVDDYGDVFGNGILFHCGSIYFKPVGDGSNVTFNISISYKVALKG